MIVSRKLDDLLPHVRKRVERFIAECDRQGIDLLVTATYRDHEAQNALYAQGRDKPGLIVTNARGGQSFHNFRCAVDVVPLRGGKPAWGTTGIDAKLWAKVGLIGESCGLSWAGRWNGRLREMAHFQYDGGLTLAQLQAGARIPESVV